MTGLDTALEAVTGERIDVVEVIPVTGGAQRETVFVDVDRDGIRHRWVVSVQRSRIDGIPLASEVRAIDAARSAGVHAPEVVAWSDDDDLLGGPFMVTRRAPGEAIGRRVQRMADADDGLAQRIVMDLGTELARLHTMAVAPDDLAVLDGAAYVARLRDEAHDLVRPSATIAAGLAWLSVAPPDLGEACLVHGDLRIGNVVVDRGGITAIIDWELAHRGDPMEDLAWATVRTWRYGREPEVGGLGSVEELIAAYGGAGGTFDRGRFEWWRIARTVWWCIGLGRQCAAWMRGGGPSLVHAASGRRLAEIEWDLLDLLESELRSTP